MNNKNRIKPIVPHRVIELKEQLEKKNVELKQLADIIKKEEGNIKVTCTNDVYGPGCGNQQRIGDTIYIQTTYKEYECGVGYMWFNGEGQFKCNKCGKITRLYDCDEIVKLQKSFKDIDVKQIESM